MPLASLNSPAEGGKTQEPKTKRSKTKRSKCKGENDSESSPEPRQPREPVEKDKKIK